MADLDDLREGADFGLGMAQVQTNFHVKGLRTNLGNERPLVAHI